MKGRVQDMNGDEGYNGYTNYETWACKLWIDNEESGYRYWREQTRDVIESARENGEAPDVGYLADQLRDVTEENAPDIGASFYSDLMSMAISRVDFDQLATMMIEDETYTGADE